MTQSEKLKSIDDSRKKREGIKAYNARIEKLKNETLDDALKQIEEKGYSTRFYSSEKAMFKAAVVFSKEGNGLLGWKEGDR